MTSSGDYVFEQIGPLHAIYVGSGPSRIISEEDRQRILTQCSIKFDSFTLIEARGYFRGASEQTLLIQVATDDLEQVRSLAFEIAVTHDQLGVGIVSPKGSGAQVYGRVIPNRSVARR